MAIRTHSSIPDLALAAAFGVLALAASGCGGDQGTHSRSVSTVSWLRAPIPARPGPLARRVVKADRGLRRAITTWRSDGSLARSGPPVEVASRADYLRRASELLSRRPGLAKASTRRMPGDLAHEVGELSAAIGDLRRLSASWPPQHVATGPAKPLGLLLGYYRGAQRRFGVDWSVLAAVNLVESDFGRVRTKSVAGAEGPMQFMPSTWRSYGMGGDIGDPHDAILGAANLLHQSGAPAHYERALQAYNPSHLYVDAVLRYAGLIAADPDAIYYLYSW